MAANPYGMLGLGAPEAMDDQRINARQRQAMDYARMTPAQQSSYNASNAAQMTGRGMGELVGLGIGAATGSDTRNPADKARGVQQQMTAALKDVDPSDIDTAYPIMIRILRDNGMTPEAMAMAKEYEDLKLKKQDRTLRQGDLDRRRAADASKVEMFNTALASKDPMRMVEAYGTLAEALLNATPEEKVGIQNRMRALEGVLKVRPEKDAQGNWKVTVQQGNKSDPARVIKYNSVTGETTVETLDGKPAGEGKSTDPLRPSGEAKTPAPIRVKWGDMTSQLGTLVELSQSFRPEFAGGTAAKIATAVNFQDLTLKLKELAGENPAASAWWAEYANLILQVRHDLFGATLTGGESNAFDTVRALVGAPPGNILARLAVQAKAGISKWHSQVKSVGGDYNVADQYPIIDALRPQVEGMPRSASGGGTTRNVAPAAPAPAAAPAASVMPADVAAALAKHGSR
jgi:hypothetical protein